MVNETKVKAPTNSKEWSDFHAQVIADMVNGGTKHHIAKEVNNGFGKQISNARAVTEYYAERKEKPVVPWLVGKAA